MSQITITEPSPALWRASIDNPPVNVIGSQLITELRKLVEAAESDPDLVVILFESANPDFFLAHWDLTDDASSLPPGPTGQGPFVDILIRISKLPVITVSAVRGRARGAGSEFLLATDIRFASRERAVLSQFEVSAGVVPGGGSVTRLQMLVGRARAIEIIGSADDYSGELLERYGYVNRVVPEAEFDEFIDAFVSRIAGFKPRAIHELKKLTEVSLPPDEQFVDEAGAFFGGLALPDVQDWIGRMFERGLQQHGEVELNLTEIAEKP